MRSWSMFCGPGEFAQAGVFLGQVMEAEAFELNRDDVRGDGTCRLRR